MKGAYFAPNSFYKWMYLMMLCKDWTNQQTREAYIILLNDPKLYKELNIFIKESNGNICLLGEKIELYIENLTNINPKYKKIFPNPLYYIDFYEIAEALIFNNI